MRGAHLLAVKGEEGHPRQDEEPQGRPDHIGRGRRARLRVAPSRVEVFSNAGAFTDNVAEHAWGIILGVAKGIHLRNQRTAPRSLRGKTLLVLGCGAIGSEVARLSKSLGMRNIGLSRSFRSPDMFDERHPLSLLAAKITQAEVVLVALPLTKETRGVVTYDILTKARESAILANVGRGS